MEQIDSALATFRNSPNWPGAETGQYALPQNGQYSFTSGSNQPVYPNLMIPNVLGSDMTTVGTRWSSSLLFTIGQAPDTVLYRLDNNSNITSYAVCASDGLIACRVDVIGDLHNGISTPHTVYYLRNVTPGGMVFLVELEEILLPLHRDKYHENSS